MKRTQLEVSDKDILLKHFECLDITPLNEKLSELLGFNPQLNKKATEKTVFGHNNLKIEIKSDTNFVDKCGIIALGLKSAKIQDFGTHLYKILEYDEEEVERKRKENNGRVELTPLTHIVGYTFHVCLDIRYELISGGTNGITILSADYDFNNNAWTFYPTRTGDDNEL